MSYPPAISHVMQRTLLEFPEFQNIVKENLESLTRPGEETALYQENSFSPSPWGAEPNLSVVYII
jgi:hypothetical protein